jgi:hypothetical protein
MGLYDVCKMIVWCSHDVCMVPFLYLWCLYSGYLWCSYCDRMKKKADTSRVLKNIRDKLDRTRENTASRSSKLVKAGGGGGQFSLWYEASSRAQTRKVGCRQSYVQARKKRRVGNLLVFELSPFFITRFQLEERATCTRKSS